MWQRTRPLGFRLSVSYQSKRSQKAMWNWGLKQTAKIPWISLFCLAALQQVWVLLEAFVLWAGAGRLRACVCALSEAWRRLGCDAIIRGVPHSMSQSGRLEVVSTMALQLASLWLTLYACQQCDENLPGTGLMKCQKPKDVTLCSLALSGSNVKKGSMFCLLFITIFTVSFCGVKSRRPKAVMARSHVRKVFLPPFFLLILENYISAWILSYVIFLSVLLGRVLQRNWVRCLLSQIK